MNNYDRNNKYNLNYERQLEKQLATENKVADASRQQQVPKPEPRKRLTHSITGLGETRLENELAMDNQHVARLVKINHHHHQETRHYPDEKSQVKITSLADHKGSHQSNRRITEIPIDFASDEGVGSPTNNDATYEEDDDIRRRTTADVGEVEGEDELADDYYEDEETCSPSSQRVPKSEELASLSRQSMVPIHELIAYYQYIQHGDQHLSIDQAMSSSSATTSRQSSSASQLTTRTRQSDDIVDEADGANTILVRTKRSASLLSDREDEDSGDSKSASGIPINATSLEGPEIVVENVEQTNQDDCEAASNEAVKSQITVPMPVKVQDRSRLRANVVLELINSERDFVKHLKDVVEGYLHRARKHPEIFTGQRINTIFANIEQLYEFQGKFLEELSECINWDDLASSEVGNCFLKYEKGFSVYHYYCNNHPNATSELQDLYTKPIFRAFFEECRLKRNMIDISLDGFLLTPIQKICKYPLQLTELLKNTDEHHPDHGPVSNALVSMRNCANLANERKRRIEALADVMSFQEKFDNWFGPKLSDTSSILVHSGEVSKMTSHTWSQGVQLFLFDRLLLYSKKDLLKRNNLILKGRICMDTITEISDADEYKPRKSFKLYCGEQQKWFVFTTKSEKEKDEWIHAFERERNLVEADENEGFHITDRELGIARRTLQHRKRSRSARYRHKRPDTANVDQLEVEDPNIFNRTLSLPSCIHPSHVMNFVEDSRVVSNASNSASGRGKKNASPVSNSRSPISSTQQLAEHPDHQSGPTNWLRKMGSKKLSKSQVYNINGQTGHHPGQGSGQQRNQQPAAQNTNEAAFKPALATSTSGYSIHSATSVDANSVLASDDAAATKYEVLEKRYRDHMVSEEQARLYRLNNDLPPPPTLYPRSVTPTTHPINNHGPTSGTSSKSKTPPAHQSASSQRQTAHFVASNHQQLPDHIGGEHLFEGDHWQPPKSNSIGQNSAAAAQQDDLARFSSLNLGDNDQAAATRPEPTFETELILSSGRVVRVREDAV